MNNPITTESVKHRLLQLRLKDMAKNLETLLDKANNEQWGRLMFLSECLNIQRQAVQQRSLERRIKIAIFPHHMNFDTFDWAFQPSLNVEYLKDLMGLAFVTHRHRLLILGKTGTGKTHIAAALGTLACQAQFKVAFFELQPLLAKLYTSVANDTTDLLISQITRFDLLIIDNVSFIRTKTEYPSLLLDLITACQDRTAIIATSNIGLEDWGSALGNPSITHAIVDRLLHHASIINIRPGRSYRTEGPHAPTLSPTSDSSAHPDK